MSASLVGSEMCIRDRDQPGPPANAAGPAAARGFQLVGGPSRDIARKAAGSRRLRLPCLQRG
eukprot:4471881-Alexandrium_andersonii.AAC.1